MSFSVPLSCNVFLKAFVWLAAATPSRSISVQCLANEWMRTLLHNFTIAFKSTPLSELDGGTMPCHNRVTAGHLRTSSLIRLPICSVGTTFGSRYFLHMHSISFSRSKKSSLCTDHLYSLAQPKHECSHQPNLEHHMCG